MKIWWFKDSKIGHEKQVHAILNNLALTENLDIDEIYVTNPVWLELFLYIIKIKPKKNDKSYKLIWRRDQKSTCSRFISMTGLS